MKVKTNQQVVLRAFVFLAALMSLPGLTRPAAGQNAGDLDQSFGSGGIAGFAISTLDDRANALALQADGKILLAGTADIGSAQGSRFSVARIVSEDSNGGLPPGNTSGGGCFIDAGRND